MGATPSAASADLGLALAGAQIAAAVLAGVVGPALLANGQKVEIALARRSDLERVRRFYQTLGDTSTYYRFFGIRRALPDDELRGVVTVRLPDHVTLLASIGHRLIGVGEYVPRPDPREVEVAFAVADDHHHEGVATLLLERLAIIAQRSGKARLTALTLPGNDDMQLVFRTVGLPVVSQFEPEDGTIHVSLDLSGIEAMLRQSLVRHDLAERLSAL